MEKIFANVKALIIDEGTNHIIGLRSKENEEIKIKNVNTK
jgi:hypothetical protein